MSYYHVAVKLNEGELPIAKRPLNDEEPHGYLESDRDWVMNNLDLCIKFLKSPVIKTAIK
jgi:hypothetical protein